MTAEVPNPDEARIVAEKYAALLPTKWPHNQEPTDLIAFRNVSIYLARAYLSVSAVTTAEGWCPDCKGSGTVKGMTHGRGPDDHEIDVDCQKCGGTGAGVVDPSRLSTGASNSRPATLAESLGVLLARLSDHLSPREKKDIEAAILLANERDTWKELATNAEARLSATTTCSLWHEWHGGNCPVDPEAMVEYRCRDQLEAIGVARTLDWDHDDDNHHSDIMAYRIAQMPAADSRKA